ncbi:MAG: plasmid pRiA4b ORF-3 family protein [Gemmatimonas sp.]
MPKRSPRKQTLRVPQAVGIELHIEFAHITPAIWRVVLVQSRMTLEELHALVQLLFCWDDAHLFRFTHAKRAFMRPNPEFAATDAIVTTLGELQLNVGDIITYEYDFGDRWELRLRVDAIEPYEPGVQYPQCLAGARAGPPGDCGGPPFYAEFLAILADPTHPEHQERLDWVGPHFHPEAIDLRTTNRLLGILFNYDSAT